MVRKICIMLLSYIAIESFSYGISAYGMNEQDGQAESHGYVDLGLPSGTLWATCNIGAETPYDSGMFFAWGETEPRDRFVFETYKYFEGVDEETDGVPVYRLTDIGEDICGTEYDAAAVLWKDGWRMPNKAETEELLKYCSVRWETGRHFAGLHVCGPNGNSIFLPASSGPASDISPAVIAGDYWTGTLGFAESGDADGILASSMSICNDTPSIEDRSRCQGMNIRPVVCSSDTETSVEALDSGLPRIRSLNGTLVIDQDCTGWSVRIVDLSGKCVFSSNEKSGSYTVSGLEHGTYIVRAVNNSARGFVQKIIL